VERGLAIMADKRRPPTLTDAQRTILFGEKQHEKR
jgi:hypothetical protein